LDEDPQQRILLLQEIFLNPINWEITLAIGTMFFLLLCSALISGSEVAFFSLNPNNWQEKDLCKGQVVIKKLMHHPNHLLATILITNNFVNVAIIILSTYITAGLFNFNGFPILEFIIQVVVITFLLLLLGEVIPKVFANQNALVFASFMSTPINILSKVFAPISNALVATTYVIEKRFQNKGYQISVDELSTALDLAGENDTNEDEKRILRSIVEFGNIDVKEIMKSRVDVIAIDEQASFEDIKKLVVSSGYSRIPVYKENFDTILGVIYIKDMLPHIKEEKFDWTSLVRTPFFVPESKMIDDLLKEFQEKKIHLAIVVDEYGGTSGIVTLEDIIEEIVGEINDEFDDDGIMFSKLDNSNYIFEGKTSLNDVLKTIDGEIDYFDEVKGDTDTLAGLILELKGNIPEKGEVLVYKLYTFSIESVDQRRVKRVKISIDA
tara:strand:+ start:6529 stop:7842 length:1314 start_codon:yes stop_codon:yes gene_type:complete